MSREYLALRRDEILGAAERCFAREGFHRTTMQHVVREARRSPGAIYRYFESKEEIVTAIARRRHRAERELLQGALATEDARAGLAALARGFLGRLTDPSEQRWRRITVQLWAEALRNARVRRIVTEGLDEPLKALAALVRRARSSTKVPAADPEALARVVAAVFQGLVLQQAWNEHLDVSACLGAAEALLGAAFEDPSRRLAVSRRSRARG